MSVGDVRGIVRYGPGGVGRLRQRLLQRHDPYVVCPVDGFAFRPVYSAGKCPLCGEEVAGGAPSLPALVRVDRFRFGMGMLVLVCAAMSALVLYMYFAG